jgi:hypothetical protein
LPTAARAETLKGQTGNEQSSKATCSILDHLPKSRLLHLEQLLTTQTIMDEFAQSRGEDDLFEDDIVPIEPTEEPLEVETIAKQVKDISLDTAPKGPAATTHYHRGYDTRGDRGRARGGRGRGVDRVDSRQQSSSLLQSKYAPQSTQSNHTSTPSLPAINTPGPAKSVQGEPNTASVSTAGAEEQNQPLPAAPTEPSTPARPPAVRGDRTATGGIKKPKLTEEELTAKLAAAKTRSENLSAAHARAEADAARFAERERAAAEKRLKDAANRKVMEGEREKNRARKMAVMGGREWDAEKNEEDFKVAARGRGRGNYARGGNGGVRMDFGDPADDDLRQYQWRDDRGGGRGQGQRRGRGNERGAPRGRADHRNGDGRQPDVGAEADFPSLPATIKPREDGARAKRPEQSRGSSEVMSPTVGAGSWADQVEVSEATKPKVG